MQLPISHYITLDVSPTVVEILTHLDRKWLAFPSHPCLTPSSGGQPCDISAVYTKLKSTFNGLQIYTVSGKNGPLNMSK